MSNETNTEVTKSGFGVRYIAMVGMLSALAFVLQFIEFPIPMLIPPFIKFDFSDLPALIGAFAFGPLAGVLIELIKNLVHCLVSQSFTVGELSNFILGAAFTLTAGFIYKAKKTKQRALIGGLLGSLVMGIISFPSNILVVYPFYYNFMPEEVVLDMYKVIAPSMKNMVQCLLVFNVPFTIIKGLISVAITMLVYKSISPLLKGKDR